MMRILLTNDDGIDAPGLRALWESIRHAFGAENIDVTVVAPDRQRSECGHSVTNHRPLKIDQTETDWYAVDGTPVDCIRVALGAIITSPTMVLSGINSGANLGVDLLSSGTFAAAREAAVHRIPAMAVSHYRRSDVVRSWDHTPRWLASTLVEFQTKISNRSSGELLWNVNLPAIDPASDPPPRQRCHVDPCPLERQAIRGDDSVRFASDFHARPREQGSDIDRCFSGALTISELNPHT